MSDTPAIVVMGSRGMLGRAVSEALDRRGAAWRRVNRPEFELTDPDAIAAAIGPGVETVINCAAWTDVDGAEADEAGADAANHLGSRHLAERCAAVGAVMVHYSTDYVFPGDARSPWPVDAPIAPINAYGRTKAAGEAAIRAVGPEHLILRTSWLYAPWGKNFVLTMRRLLREKDTLTVVDDQRGRPTSAEHLADATLGLLDADARGTLHVSDAGQCTWCGFARKINELLDAGCDVQPCTTDAFPRPAKRPAYSVLDLAATEAIVGPRPHWHDTLRAVLDRVDTLDAAGSAA